MQKGTKPTIRRKRKRKDTKENAYFLVQKKNIDMTKIIDPGTMEEKEIEKGGVKVVNIDADLNMLARNKRKEPQD